MDEPHLYQQIAEAIRQDILSGNYKPGERLPTMRQMTSQWGCATGTILRAYQLLARQGLIVSHVGQGTRVAEQLPGRDHTPLRRAYLFNRAEAFLLEIMTSGYSPEEVEQAMFMALDQWRTFSGNTPAETPGVLRFVGSHDPALAMIAAHFREVYPAYTLQLTFSGSLGGLIALAEKTADLAGCHLWDEESDTYNASFVRHILPNQRVALLTLAHRKVGLIVAHGNPRGIKSLNDLARPGVRFVNRQQGAGTRVWLDAQLRLLGIDPGQIQGYEEEKLTHSEVGRSVARGEADAGLGVQSAALVFGLGFELLTTERYDLAIPEEKWDLPAMQALHQWLNTPQARAAIHNLGGYDTRETGDVTWVD